MYDVKYAAICTLKWMEGGGGLGWGVMQRRAHAQAQAQEKRTTIEERTMYSAVHDWNCARNMDAAFKCSAVTLTYEL